jgi:hypothetical protein
VGVGCEEVAEAKVNFLMVHFIFHNSNEILRRKLKREGKLIEMLTL